MRGQHDQSNGKLVAVVDDDNTILQAMDGLLQSWGYNVVTAVSDAEALYRIADLRRRPDLIICDYRLAEGQFGFQAIERMRAALEIPAMLITGESTGLDTQEGGIDRSRMLFKPLNPNELKEAVAQVFESEFAFGLAPS
jgi:CheY-like chemotaxis protein